MLDFDLGLGFGTWIWDLGLGLGLDNIHSNTIKNAPGTCCSAVFKRKFIGCLQVYKASECIKI